MARGARPDARARAAYRLTRPTRALLPSEPFDVVVLKDDCFVRFLRPAAAQCAALRAIQAQLAPHGRSLSNVTTPQLELAAPGTFDYNPLTQIKTAPGVWEVADQRANDPPRRVTVGFERRRLTCPPELELLPPATGFAPVHRWGDPCKTPFADPRTQHYHMLEKVA